MKQRFKWMETEPGAIKAMMGLENYLHDMPLNPIQKELVKIRASQINACAHCLEMHTEEARKIGESEQRIYALSAWRQSALFSEEERALLALTEEVTLISHGGVRDETYQRLKKFFDDRTIMQFIMGIIAINGWNRLNVSSYSDGIDE